MLTDNEFIPPGTDVTLRTPSLGCDSSNVVYLLHCNICDESNYVGEISTAFRFRFNNHKQNVRDNLDGFPVAEHFNSPGHSLNNLRCILLSSGFPSTEARRKTELRLIIRLKSHTHGLNRKLGFLTGYTFFHNTP